MDTPTSAAPDEKTPPPELALATQLGQSLLPVALNFYSTISSNR
jgi:hypothetical protein